MTQKIYERHAMRLGHQTRYSLMVTIPKKICKALQIEKNTRLYFKLEGCKFVVSRDIKSLEDAMCNDNNTVETIESTKKENGSKEKEIIVDGISLADLQY
ncbi:AbrB/MazE/SpoVT family DNA-binding domain-containing protein [Candidatus Nitrosotalea sp. TS]|uniref:AbrB/MazE/SpoVT family DNA-binding domain-containing protein n=1 Tax=Candidatus Nitrosotalea sp. TS TaxID=2341020 RepID=UPI00140DDA07|nr:AbrB/MazE/SpoVT family DNA-binding domain-containing protein [Candidatus Nitrosotalea sp. TS]